MPTSHSIELLHGAGGRATARLVAEFGQALANEWLGQGDDGAVLPPLPVGHRLVLSTDAHVVSPLFFPGGDIGALAVHGTVNDVAMMGARPLWLSVAFILEEGFATDDLRVIVHSLATAAKAAGVAVVAGDTKVVEKGKGDGLYIATTGAGALPPGRAVSGANAKPGDAVLLSGPIGAHGLAILNAREKLDFAQGIVSDSAALNGLTEALFASGATVHVLRDPTRGGVAATLNEIAHQSGVAIELQEAALPIARQVASACEFLGLDPLDLANEGVMLVFCPANDAERALSALRAHPLGTSAARIGEVQASERPQVRLKTAIGGLRRIEWPTGSPLPRIC
ncbi:MAG: hydrogenase expression/formation protein HypE [Zoogloeaceae bacterium]|jgi:hydrogenase expression/formation protein HypE|nr:hydrogenase expression/formation protein HypE [Zoogloeaceae bacterium]